MTPRRLVSLTFFAALSLPSMRALAHPTVTAGPILSTSPVVIPLEGPVSSVAYGAGEYMALWPTGAGYAVGRADAAGQAVDPMETIFAGVTSGTLDEGTLAFDGTDFRAFWHTSTAPGGLGAAVIAPSGLVTHSFWSAAGPAIPPSYEAAACTPAGECAVVWATGGNNAGGDIYGIRFDAKDNPLDSTPILLLPRPDGGAEATAIQFAPVASGYLLIAESAAQSTARAFDATLTPLGAALTIPVPATPGYIFVAGSSAGAALVWQTAPGAQVSALLFDGTGAPRETTPLSLGQSAGNLSAVTAVGKSDFALYVAGFQAVVPGDVSTQAEVWRLAASDAGANVQVAMPAADFGSLGTGCLASDGANVLVVALPQSEYPLMSALVANGATSVTAAPFRNVTEPETLPALTWNGSRFLAGWETASPTANASTINLATIDLTGKASPLTSFSYAASDLALASNGSGYDVVVSGSSETDVYATTDGGTPAQTASVNLGFALNPGNLSVATNGSQYLVIYPNPNERDPTSIDGLADDAPDGGSPSVFQPPFQIGVPNTYGQATGVAWSGSSYAVAWTALSSTASPTSAWDTAAAFVSPAGSVVAGPLSLTEDAGSGTDFAVACAPGSCVFAWTTPTGAIATRPFDASGAPSGPAATLSGASEVTMPRIAWDGREYVLAALAGHDGLASDLVATSLDATGAVSGGGFATISAAAATPAGPMRVASDGAGHTAVLFVRFQDQRESAYLLEAADAADAGSDAGDAGPIGDDAGTEAGSGPDDGGAPSMDATAGDAGNPGDAESDDGGDGGPDASGPSKGATSSSCGCTSAGAPATFFPFPALLALAALGMRRRRR